MNGVTEEAGQVAKGVVNGLASSPFALALVVINVLFLIAGGLFIWTIAGISKEGALRRDALMSQLAKDCIIIAPGGKQ